MEMDALASNLRIAALSIALFDYIQTVPGEYALYKRAYQTRRTNLVVFFFFVSRYVGIIALVTNCIGYFSTSFTQAECNWFHLVAPLTKLIAGLGAQGVIFLRTYAISRQSRYVLFILSSLTILCIPPQIIGNVYLRYPSVKDGNCTSRVHTAEGDYHTGWIYYFANLVFDVVACTIATFSIWQQFRGSTMSQFTRSVLKHGVIYAAVTTVANLLCLLALLDLPIVRGLGSTLSIAITMIMCQHLVLATYHLSAGVVHDLPIPEIDALESGGRRRFSGPQPTSASYGQRFQLSGVRIHTETIQHIAEPKQPEFSKKYEKIQRPLSSHSTLGSTSTGYNA